MSVMGSTDISKRKKTIRILVYVLLGIWVLAFNFPLFWMVRTSLCNKLAVYSLSFMPTPPQVASIELDATESVNARKNNDIEKAVKALLIKDISRSAYKIFNNSPIINEIRILGLYENKKVIETTITRFDVREIKLEYHSFESFLNNSEYIVDQFDTNYFNFEEIDNDYQKIYAEDEPAENLRKVVRDIDTESQIRVNYVKYSYLRMLDSYRDAWNIFGRQSFGKFFINSIIYVAGVIIISTTISAFGAYALSRLLPKGISKFLLFAYIITIMIPEVLLFVPLFLMMKEFPFPSLPNINLLNTYWGMILPHTAWGFSILLFKSFFDQIPDELIEAARIDGASEVTTFFRIVIPLSKAVIGVVAIFTFVSVWMNFLWPFIVAQKREMWTYTVALFNLQNSTEFTVLGENVIMASSTISLIPSVIFFLFVQRFISEGIALQGIKG